MKLVNLACAVHAVRDAETDAVSLFHLLDLFEHDLFPVSIPSFSVYALLEKEPSDPGAVECLVRVSLGSAELSEQTFSVDFLGRKYARFVRVFPPVYLMEPGTLAVELLGDGKKIHRHEIVARRAGRSAD
jgi:hypothetical protein